MSTPAAVVFSKDNLQTDWQQPNNIKVALEAAVQSAGTSAGTNTSNVASNSSSTAAAPETAAVGSKDIFVPASPEETASLDTQDDAIRTMGKEIQKKRGEIVTIENQIIKLFNQKEEFEKKYKMQRYIHDQELDNLISPRLYPSNSSYHYDKKHDKIKICFKESAVLKNKEGMRIHFGNIIRNLMRHERYLDMNLSYDPANNDSVYPEMILHINMSARHKFLQTITSIINGEKNLLQTLFQTNNTTNNSADDAKSKIANK